MSLCKFLTYFVSCFYQYDNIYIYIYPKWDRKVPNFWNMKKKSLSDKWQSIEQEYN